METNNGSKHSQNAPASTQKDTEEICQPLSDYIPEGAAAADRSESNAPVRMKNL